MEEIFVTDRLRSLVPAIRAFVEKELRKTTGHVVARKQKRCCRKNANW
jgi:hypothetical protein